MSRLSALVVVLALFASATVAADITDATVAAFQLWTGAVMEHVPGRADESLSVALSLTFEQRVALDEGMPLFLSALQGRNAPATAGPARRLLAIARKAAGDDVSLFLKRAAVLHGDAAIARGGHANDGAYVDAAGRGGSTSPIFPKGFQILDDDGESKGRVPRDWNWVFARSLLDLLSPRNVQRPFLAAWYHATTAQMFRDGTYGEAKFHLDHALELLPDNPRLLFDLACLSEVDGLPIVQQTLSDEELEKRRKQFAPGTGRVNTAGRNLSIAALTVIPPVEVANGDAEWLFRRALQGDPSLNEAHARLARLLTIRGRYVDALNEAEAALAAKPDREIAFYAHLFAGRAARELGRLGAAADHYAQAQALFPNAQSAAIGASQVALLRADVPAATAVVQRLPGLAAKADSKTDPWWTYRYGPGRISDDLLGKMWSTIGAPK